MQKKRKVITDKSESKSIPMRMRISSSATPTHLGPDSNLRTQYVLKSVMPNDDASEKFARGSDIDIGLLLRNGSGK
jgi:hypothetical protein